MNFSDLPFPDKEGFSSELGYWEKELTLQGHYPEAIRNRTEPERMQNEFPADLDPIIQETRSKFRVRPRVLDVGSGPLSMLAYGAETGMIDLTAVDPLMDHYAELRTKHNYDVRYRCLQGFGEDLATQFPEGSFDIAWIYNALDHSQQPEGVLRGMVCVLREGGFLVVQNWSREGTAEGWCGLHKHDIYLAPDRSLMCETRSGDCVMPARCISADLPIEIQETSDPTSEVKKWVRLIARKCAR